MAFFGMVEDQQVEQIEPFGILPAGAAPQAPRGIMDYLRDPYVRAALSGASRGFANAAQSGVRGTGYALAQGFSGAAEGATSWEEQQAKRAAERVNQMAADRRGVTDYRYRLNLVAQRIAKEKGIPLEEAELEAEQIMATQGFENQQQLVGIRGEEARATASYVKDLERQLEEFKMGKAPEVAAAVATAETTARLGAEKSADVGVKVEKAEDAIAELQGMESDLKMLPSPVGMDIENIKAYWGGGNKDTQETIGRIKRRAGSMLKYVDRLPGAATDADREVFMASAGILGATDPSVTPEAKIGAVRDAIAAYRRLIQKYGKPAAAKAGGASQGEIVYRRDPKTGKMVRSSQ